MNFFDRTHLEIFSGLSQYKIRKIEEQLTSDLPSTHEYNKKSVSEILKKGGYPTDKLKKYLANMRFKFHYVSEPLNQFDIFYGLVNDGVNAQDAWQVSVKQSPTEYAEVLGQSSYLSPLIGHEIREEEHRRNFLKSLMNYVAPTRNHNDDGFLDVLTEISHQSIFGLINIDGNNTSEYFIKSDEILELCSFCFDERKRTENEIKILESTSKTFIEGIEKLKPGADLYNTIINMTIYNYAARMFLKCTPAGLICKNIYDVSQALFSCIHEKAMVDVLVRQALVNVACAINECLPFVVPTNNEIMGIFEDNSEHKFALQSPFKSIMSGPVRTFMPTQMRMERIAQFTHFMGKNDYAITFENAINGPIGKSMLIADLLDLKGGQSKTLVDLIEKGEIDPETLSNLASRINPRYLSNNGFINMWVALLNHCLNKKPTRQEERIKIRNLQQSTFQLLNVHLEQRHTSLQVFAECLVEHNALTIDIFDLLKLNVEHLKRVWIKTPQAIKKHALAEDLAL